MSSFTHLLTHCRGGGRLSAEQVFALLDADELQSMMAVATELRDRGHGAVVSYSRKVFIPLTQLCRDSCHYCTFAHPPRRGARAYLSAEDVLAIARAGTEAGCREALFTLGRQAGVALLRGARRIGAIGTRIDDLVPRRHGGDGAGAEWIAATS